jgi:hypothetical protein
MCDVNGGVYFPPEFLPIILDGVVVGHVNPNIVENMVS